MPVNEKAAKKLLSSYLRTSHLLTKKEQEQTLKEIVEKVTVPKAPSDSIKKDKRNQSQQEGAQQTKKGSTTVKQKI